MARARTRKKEQEPTATEAPEQPPAAESAAVEPIKAHIQPEGIVHAPAEPSSPEQPRPKSVQGQPAPEAAHTHSEHSHAERHHKHREHAHTEHRTQDREHGQSHADAVGKRAGYSPAGIIDRVAGVRLAEYQDTEKKLYLSVIRFDEQPSDAAKQILRDASFQWRQQQKEWTRPVRFETRAQDRLHAERTFEQACEQRRADKGITHSFGGA